MQAILQWGPFSPCRTSYYKILVHPYHYSPKNMANYQTGATSAPGPIFCLLLRVSSDYAQPIIGQVTEVTCPAIGQAQPDLTLSKRQKTGPGLQLFVLQTALGWCPRWLYLYQSWNEWQRHDKIDIMMWFFLFIKAMAGI